MNKTLKVVLISKDKILYEGEAFEIILPTKAGVIAVLPNHMEIVSALKKGQIIIKNGEEKKFEILGGVLEVRKNSNVIILVN